MPEDIKPFDPSQPFTLVEDAPQPSTAPRFDPSKPFTELPDDVQLSPRGEPMSRELGFGEFVGQGFKYLGNIVKAPFQDTAEAWAGPVNPQADVRPFRNTQAAIAGDETPYDVETKDVDGLAGGAKRFSEGVLEAVPKMVAAGKIGGGVAAAGVKSIIASAIGAGTAFGFTDKGFDPVQGLIMAGLPFAQAAGGQLTKAFLSTPTGQKVMGAILGEAKPVLTYALEQPDNVVKMALDSQYRGQPWLTPELVQRTAQTIGGIGTVNLYLDAVSTVSALGLPPEQFKDAVMKEYANNLALSTLSLADVLHTIPPEQRIQFEMNLPETQYAKMNKIGKLLNYGLRASGPEAEAFRTQAERLAKENGVVIRDGLRGQPFDWNKPFTPVQENAPEQPVARQTKQLNEGESNAVNPEQQQAVVQPERVGTDEIGKTPVENRISNQLPNPASQPAQEAVGQAQVIPPVQPEAAAVNTPEAQSVAALGPAIPTLPPNSVAPVKFIQTQDKRPQIAWYEPTTVFQAPDGGVYGPNARISNGQLERWGYSIPPVEQQKRVEAVKALAQPETITPKEETKAVVPETVAPKVETKPPRSIRAKTTPNTPPTPVTPTPVAPEPTNIESLLRASMPDAEEARARVKIIDKKQAELRDEYKRAQTDVAELDKKIKPQRGNRYNRSQIKKSASKFDVAKYHELNTQLRKLDEQMRSLDDAVREDRRLIDSGVDASIVNDETQPMLRRLDRRVRMLGEGAPKQLVEALRAETRRVILEKYPDATEEEIKSLTPELQRSAFWGGDLWADKGSGISEVQIPTIQSLRTAQLDAAVNERNVPRDQFSDELTAKLRRFRNASRIYGKTPEPNAPVEPLTAQDVVDLKAEISAETAKIHADNEAERIRHEQERIVEREKSEKMMKEAQAVADSAGHPGVAGGRTAKEVKADLVERLKVAIDGVIERSEVTLTKDEEGRYTAKSASNDGISFGWIEPQGSSFRVTVKAPSHDDFSATVKTQEEAEWVIKAMASSGPGHSVVGVPGDGVYRLLQSGDTMLRIWSDARKLEVSSGDKTFHKTSGGAEKPPTQIKTANDWKEARDYHGLDVADTIHDWSPALLKLAQRLNPEHPELVTVKMVDDWVESQQKKKTPSEPSPASPNTPPTPGEPVASATGINPFDNVPPTSELVGKTDWAIGRDAIVKMLDESVLPAETVKRAKFILKELPPEYTQYLTLKLLSNEGGVRMQGTFYDVLNAAEILHSSEVGPKVVAEEIIHSLARFLPPEMRAENERRWRAALEEARSTATGKEREYLDLILKHNGLTSTETVAFWMGDPDAAQSVGKLYPLSNPDEFFADEFSKATEEQRNSSWIMKFLKAILDAIKKFFGGNSNFYNEVFNAFRNGTIVRDVSKGMLFEKNRSRRAGSIESALKMQGEKNAEEPGSGDENLRMEQAAQVMSGINGNDAAITNLLAIANTPLPPNATPQMRQDKAVAQRVLGNPFFRTQFVKPVLDVRAAATALGGSMSTYGQVKNDPNATPAIKSGMAGKASKDIDQFYGVKHAFDTRYDAKRASMVEALNEAVKQGADNDLAKDMANALMDDFLTLGQEAVEQSGDKAAVSAFQKLRGQKQAVLHVLQWITNNGLAPLIGAGGVTQTQQVVQLMENHARTQPGFQSLQQSVGADDATINAVARYVLLSEPLRVSLANGANLVAQIGQSVPYSEIKEKMAKAISSGNYDQAIKLMTEGVGNTAIERKTSAEAAQYFARKEKQMLVNIAALDGVKRLFDQTEASPDFRTMAAQVYKDIGARQVIRGMQGNKYVLDPVFPDQQPVTLSFESTQEAAEKNLAALKKLHDDAVLYLSDPTAPGYDPAKAAALKEFVDDKGWYLNPAIMPKAGHFLPSGVAKLPQFLLGSANMENPEQIPNVVLGETYGFAGEYGQRTLNALSTAMEVAGATFRDHEHRLSKLLADASNAHGLQPGQYKELILDPLAASRQYFGNSGVLEPGKPIGNGYTIRGEDMAYFKALRQFEGAVVSKLTGAAKENFEVLKNNPAGILEDVNGKQRIRLPFETGPDTTSRHIGQARTWAEQWPQLDEVGRIRLLNENLNKLLLGYVKDIGQTSWSFRYSLEDELKQVRRQLSAHPLESFSDLVERIYDIRLTSPTAPPMTRTEIARTILREIGQIFEHVHREDLAGIKASKSKINAYGGESSFNTARGKQIMPSLWYDYGSVTTGQRIAFISSAVTKFFIEHTNAIEALDEALKERVRQFEKQDELNPDHNVKKASVKERIAGKDFYSWGEAVHASRQVTLYRNKLAAAMAHTKAIAPLELGQDASVSRAVFQFITASILSGPQANIGNTFGGAMNVVLAAMMIRNQAFHSAIWHRTLIGGPQRLLSEAVGLLAHEGNPVGRKLYDALRSVQNTPLVGMVPRFLADVAEAQRQLYGQSQRDGLSLNKNLGATLAAMWEWQNTGGVVTSKVPRGMGMRAVMKGLTGLRMASQAIGQATVGKVDAAINSTFIPFVLEMTHDLESRAIKYGALREQAAKAGGWDMSDPSDARNQWTPAELAGGRIPANSLEAASVSLRDLTRRGGDVNLDSLMNDFYRRWRDARAQEQAQGLAEGTLSNDVHLFTDAQTRQMQLALAEDNNLATFASRPIAGRASKLAQTMMLFMGYPAFQMFKFARMTQRMSNKGWSRGRLQNLWLAIGAMLVATIFGTMFYQPSAEQAKRLLLGRYGAQPIIYEAANPAQLLQSMLGGWASQVPGYGTVLNMLQGTAFKNGFDINSQIVIVNLASDIFRTGKEMLQSQSSEPLVKFVQRWTFPANYLAQFTPEVAGMQEVTNVKRLLEKGAKGSPDLESALRRPGGVGQSSPITPFLNRYMNAVGRGDQAGIQQAFNDIVEYETKAGAANPQQSAARAIAGRNPITQVFGSKPTADQMSSIMANLPADQAAKVQGLLSRFEQASQAVGAGTPTFVKGEAQGGGGIQTSSGGQSTPAGAIGGSGSRSVPMGEAPQGGRLSSPVSAMRGSSIRRPRATGFGRISGRLTAGRSVRSIARSQASVGRTVRKVNRIRTGRSIVSRR